VDEPIVQIGRHDAHLRSQLEDIPAVAAEQANRWLAFAVHQGIQLQRQQPHQGRLARAVGTQNGGVFADVDGQREVVEDPRGTEDDRRAEELQERLGETLQPSDFLLPTSEF
jgi:hypothetical protein